MGGKIALLSLVIGSLGLAGAIRHGSSMNATQTPNAFAPQDKPVIAACPTFWNLAKSLDQDAVEIILTQSTAESLRLINLGQADLALAGRPLKPDEGELSVEYIAKQGYSFLGFPERAVRISELPEQALCTDLPEVEEIKQRLFLKNLELVKNHRDCPSESIAITAWENTDYSRAAPIHILNPDGSRAIVSRTPIVYCAWPCPGRIVEELKLAWQKISAP